MAAKNAGNGRVRHLDIVVALQIPNDPNWAEVVLAAKVQSLFLALRRRSIGVPLWDRRRIHEPCFDTVRIGLPPSIESRSRSSKIPARLHNPTGFFSVMQYPQSARTLRLSVFMKVSLIPNLGGQRECPASNGISTAYGCFMDVRRNTSVEQPCLATVQGGNIHSISPDTCFFVSSIS